MTVGLLMLTAVRLQFSGGDADVLQEMRAVQGLRTVDRVVVDGGALSILRREEVGDGDSDRPGSVGVHGFAAGGQGLMGLLLAHHQALAAETAGKGATAALGVAAAAEGGEDLEGSGGVAVGDQQGQVGAVDEAERAALGDVGLFSATHYFCAEWNYGDTYYCGTMANGEQVYAGAVACHPSRMGQEVEVQGVRGRCTDTGGLVGLYSQDWWCYSIERWDWPDSRNDAPCPVFTDEVPDVPGIQVTAIWLP